MTAAVNEYHIFQDFGEYKVDTSCESSAIKYLFVPRRKKTCLPGFQQSEAHTSLLTYRDYLEN